LHNRLPTKRSAVCSPSWDKVSEPDTRGNSTEKPLPYAVYWGAGKHYREHHPSLSVILLQSNRMGSSYIPCPWYHLSGALRLRRLRVLNRVRLPERLSSLTRALPSLGRNLSSIRAAGDYTHVPLAMLILGTPQPGTIASAVTDSRGRFRFVTTADRGRNLTVRISGVAPADFRSRRGYAIERLHDEWQTYPKGRATNRSW
jgi:hypothetical protein